MFLLALWYKLPLVSNPSAVKNSRSLFAFWVNNNLFTLSARQFSALEWTLKRIGLKQEIFVIGRNTYLMHARTSNTDRGVE
jgi:hypothetical protein